MRGLTQERHHSKALGPSYPELGWVPAPSYLLRRNRVLSFLEKQKPGQLLEIGCGAGTLLSELSESGFDCEALETSPQALSLAGKISKGKFNIHKEADPLWVGSFEFILALEVLEHIEDDFAALKEWVSWLKPGGYLLLSVPAGMHRWSASDVWAGHYRRYEKQSLLELLQAAGVSIEIFESYGFPLANLINPLRSFIHGRHLERREKEGQDQRRLNNVLSGVDRPFETRFFPAINNPVGRLLMRACYKLQALSLEKEWGPGYFLVARRHGNKVSIAASQEKAVSDANSRQVRS